ncbi:MAG: membrane protein insertion efficiency factor YidD [Thermoleophilia bacterium]|nr:membrane protein insertion efficiency factor YidD [Thermoleophilia bacterium]
MKQIPIFLIGLYRRLVSPSLPRRCKYHPTCSEYSIQALREWGLCRGTALSAWRILRCNPFSHGGFDPVRKKPAS